jgi:hypothetical protein
MKKTTYMMFLVGLVVPVLMTALMTGCDEMERTGFQLRPDYVELTPGSNIVSFVAFAVTTNSQTGLQLPLTWRVSDPSLGTIMPRQGRDALYVRSGAGGMNTVIAQDLAGNEGYATVKQTPERYQLKITASPEKIPIVEGSLVTLTVSTVGSAAVAPPYEWSVTDPNAGVIETGNGGASVVFRSKNSGWAAILVRDANGVTATLALMPDYP